MVIYLPLLIAAY